MSEEKKYWHLLEEFEPVQDIRLPKGTEEVVSPVSRRNFLKVLGLGTASAALIASCKQPVEKAIPYFIKPEEIAPGKAVYYASSYFNQNEFCNVLVKVRDNRPIKLEPNPESIITPNGTSGKVQASVMDVYNINRYEHPLKDNQSITWEVADDEIRAQLREIQSEANTVLLITPTVISPSTKKLIAEFAEIYGAEWHQYDAVPMNGYREANRRVFGTDTIPEYNFENADCIVSVGADFLGTWLSPVEFARQYASRRDLHKENPDLNKHYQIEAGMSLTGTSADKRIKVERAEFGKVLAYLYNKVAAESGTAGGNVELPQEVTEELDKVAADLLQKKGKSVVVCGDNNPDHQVLVNSINQILDNVGKTIQFGRNYNHYRGTEEWYEKLVNANPRAVILWDVNPVYNHPESEKIKAAIENATLSVALSSLPDETSEICRYQLPSPGYLECWDDAEYKTGIVSVMQPTLHKLFDSRQVQESLLSWVENETSWRDYIKENWKTNYFPLQNANTDTDRFWVEVLRNGELDTGKSETAVSFNSAEIEGALNTVSGETNDGGFTVELVENVNIGTGDGPLNAWLQECPDPVTRIAWGNYASISPRVAREQEIQNGDVILIGENLGIPAFVQPGQADNTISISVGYGRKTGIPEELITGVNAYPLVKLKSGFRSFASSGFNISKTEETEEMALAQGHQSMEGRPILREATYDEWKVDPAAGNELHEKIQHHHHTLYKKYDYPGHKWGMAIDLNKCIGCNACVLACNTENNIPVVGKKEVSRAHEMHWIRIDRYYSGDEDNPEVLRQPVMCQHCDNAPCENVCPVAATNHSDEGLNQMAYNRCIGTRYCNNNCPYKVRRFNWLDYTGADAIPNNRFDPANMTMDLTRMRHNPDVTVRAKGVIEKCSFCVQRIQERKLDAKNEGRQMRDGELKTACQQACPADAIVFGDMNDPNSKVSKLIQDPRNYHLLEELHTLPSVGYLTKIKNKS